MRLTEVHERILIILVALHSTIIGIVFIAAPDWTVQFGGWERIEPVFFGRQAGAFHLVLAAGYLIEYFRYRGITLIVTAKSFALVFLLACAVYDGLPWAVPVSGVGDGAMALLVWMVHRRVHPSSSA
jgi:hypothetical protein